MGQERVGQKCRIFRAVYYNYPSRFIFWHSARKDACLPSLGLFPLFPLLSPSFPLVLETSRRRAGGAL